MNTATVQMLVTDHHQMEVFQISADELSALLPLAGTPRARIVPCREGWCVTTSDGQEAVFPRRDLSRAVAHAIGGDDPPLHLRHWEAAA